MTVKHDALYNCLYSNHELISQKLHLRFTCYIMQKMLLMACKFHQSLAYPTNLKTCLDVQPRYVYVNSGVLVIKNIYYMVCFLDI